MMFQIVEGRPAACGAGYSVFDTLTWIARATVIIQICTLSHMAMHVGKTVANNHLT